MNKELKSIRNDLKTMAEKETLKLFRLARHAEKKGCTKKLVQNIREEAWQMYTIQSYPERLIVVEIMCKFKYAFR